MVEETYVLTTGGGGHLEDPHAGDAVETNLLFPEISDQNFDIGGCSGVNQRFRSVPFFCDPEQDFRFQSSVS